MRGLIVAFIVVIALSVIFGGIVGVNNINSWFPEATTQALEIDNLFKFMLIASIFVFLLVHVYLLYFVFRYRRRSTDAPNAIGDPVHGNTPLEIAWSVLPALFLVVLAGICFGIWNEMHTAQKNTLVVQVIGHQYYWEFRYPQFGTWSDINELNLPVNRAIRFDEWSPANDVIHSFWVPEFRVKQDAVPGYVTHLQVTTARTGQFPVICTEFCGVGHPQMVGKVNILSQAAWDKWLRTREATARAATTPTSSTTAAASPGKSTGSAPSYTADIQPIFQNHCAICHISIQSGGLNLKDYSGLMKGGSTAAGGPVNGAVVTPGNHTASYLWDVVEGVNLQGGQRMPLGGPYLSAGDIATIAKWIDAGAKNN